jgi:hypothetical protein
VPLVERMALQSVAEVLSGATTLEVHGAHNEDLLPTLRITRVRDASGHELFDVDAGHENQRVEAMIDRVDTEYLDLLLDLTGDQYMGTGAIDL